jgi:hypothetical protein
MRCICSVLNTEIFFCDFFPQCKAWCNVQMHYGNCEGGNESSVVIFATLRYL